MSARRTFWTSVFDFESLVLIALACGCGSSSSSSSIPTVSVTTGGSAHSGSTTSEANTGGTTSSSTGGTTPATGGSQTGGTATIATGGKTPTATGGAVASTTGGSTSDETGGVSTISTGGVSVDSTGGTSSGTSGGTTTAGTSTLVQKDCANMKALTIPLLTDFESYDGTTDPGKWSFPFDGEWPDALYGGLYPNSDGSGAYALGFIDGANNSKWSIHAANTTQASVWGGGVGLWLGCFDASAYSGISFYARGTTPLSKLAVSISMEDTSPPNSVNPAGGGTCTMSPSSGCKAPSVTVDLTGDFTLVKVPWASFTGGMGLAGTAVTATGKRINGLSFNAVMNWQDAGGTGTWTPVPAPFDIQVDNIGFY